MILEKIIKIISVQFNVAEEEISRETSFNDDLNADSLDLVELIMSLEDEFELEVLDDDVDKITTVGEAESYIKNRM
ncbi:MAG: acyl carrier protein [Gudongella sp.]|jgi:acyl carrier protein|nr:acyl carrier protein [Gudongella sp.]